MARNCPWVSTSSMVRSVASSTQLLKTIENGNLRQRGEGVGIMGAQALGNGHSIHKDAFSSLAGCGETMQQLETGHRITIRLVRVNQGGRDFVTVIARFGNAADIEDAAVIGLAPNAEESGNAQQGRFACALFDRYIAEKSQSVAANVVEPVFATGWVRDPFRVIAPGKSLGGVCPSMAGEWVVG